MSFQKIKKDQVQNSKIYVATNKSLLVFITFFNQVHKTKKYF